MTLGKFHRANLRIGLCGPLPEDHHISGGRWEERWQRTIRGIRSTFVALCMVAAIAVVAFIVPDWALGFTRRQQVG